MTTTAPTQAPPRSHAASAVRALWRRWVVANAVGELGRLGLAGAPAAADATYGPDRPTLTAAVAHAARPPRAGLDEKDVAAGEVAVVVLHDHPATTGASTGPATRRDWA